MAEKKDKIFANGMRYQIPSDKALAMGITGKISIKVDEFKAFLDQHVTNSGWVNIDIKVGRSSKPYAELNTYTAPERPKIFEEPQAPEEEEGSDAIPF